MVVNIKSKFNHKLSSHNGEHFLSFDFSPNFDIDQLKKELSHFFEIISSTKNDVIYCKIFTLNTELFARLQNALDSLISHDKVFLIAQPSLEAESSVLIYIMDSSFKNNENVTLSLKRFNHFGENAEIESQVNFENLDLFLNENKYSVLENVLRSWIYVNNIDQNYKHVVEQRKKFFDQHHITNETGYISSTGIGSFLHNNLHNQIDFLIINGLQSQKITLMRNHDVMPDTHSYGVHFERGTLLELKTRKHFYLSGTASISPEGEILYPDDPKKQAAMALSNSNDLLTKYKSSLKELTHCIVYLRNKSDLSVVKDVIQSSLNNIPIIFVHGPVCRPGWLVEVEGIAIKLTTQMELTN